MIRVPANGDIPERATTGASGYDLRAREGVLLFPGQRALIKTGLRLALPDGYEAQIRPRSGLALKHGVTVLNSPGTIDSDYRGEVGVILINLGETAASIKPGDRIAQMVIVPVPAVELVPVAHLPKTARGEGGFGSTGQ